MRKIGKAVVFLLVLLGVTFTGFAFQAHADEVKTVELYKLENPTWLSKAGISKGIGHDKQDLGIILPANVELEIRQVNPNFKENLTMELLNDGSQKEKNVAITSTWTKVSHAYTAVPMIDTTFGLEAPVIEFKFTNNMKVLPTYMQGDIEAKFFKAWDDTDAEFAFVKSRYFRMLVPKKDKAYMKNMRDFKSVNELCNYYTSIFETYNELDGLSFTPENPTDKNIPNKYFIKANAHGAGSAYYSGSHTAQNSDSLAGYYLSKGWGGLHEIGHGYQGSFMSDSAFGVGEVWNNIYAATFERNYYGANLATKGTLYANGSKEWRETTLNNEWKVKGLPMNSWSGSSKERILLAFQAKAGDKAFITFNQEYRKIANEDGFVAANHYLLDLISKYYGQASGFDFTPVIESAGGVMSKEQKEENRLNSYQAVAPLVDVVPAAKVSEVQAKLGLESYLSLVDATELRVSGLSGTASIHLDIDDMAQLKGQYLTIKNGKEVVKKVVVTDEDVALGELPNGVYTIDAPTGNTVKYALDTHYLYVKEATNKSTIKYTAKKESYLASQTVRFLGIGDRLFASAKVDLEKGQLIFNKNSAKPHDYFENIVYGKLEVLDTDGNVVYTRAMTGKDTAVDKAEIPIKEGYKLRIYHAEPGRLRADDATGRLEANDINIVNTKTQTNIFTITKKGLINDALGNNPDDVLVEKIKEVASKIEANPVLAKAQNSETRDDVWVAIQLLAEPTKTQMLEKYADLFPELVTMEVPSTTISITAPSTLSLKKDGFSGKYGTDITAVKLFVEGKLVQTATLNPENHTYTFSGLTGKRIFETSIVSVIGYDAKGSEAHQLEIEMTI
ncbi:putative mucin/carbohydrate-binding domain-containing protein [Listeria booriae]|uniref:putative mucin/carbohydrate-binding domain-containing protein n=1 Tax=Listeria booriae TaxID=1552123 RepID=UPI001626666A|nr:putative mucin/carbohydrate-binding domain-containing protein [Listeria booriae]MBC1983050.1 enhancing factor [Listeria booriae]